MRRWIGSIVLPFAVLAAASHVRAQDKPIDRLITSIDERSRVTLSGNTSPVIAQANAESISSPIPMEHMVLVLRPDSSQSLALDSLIAQQQDPKSSLFHKFLTPEEFGRRFGVSDSDLSKVTAWLSSHGFTVEETPVGHRSVVFSGTSEQVSATFNTSIRRFTVGTERHIANASDPQIPSALASVVHGVLKLHDFRHQPSLLKTQSLGSIYAPQYTAGSSHYLAPADFATIYNSRGLYTQGVDGTGQTIAIVGRSNINLTDVQAFRSQFGLAPNQPRVTIVNSDPGRNSDEIEAILDTEWSGAVAPKATINLVVAASTNTADGIDLSAQYAVNHNSGSIISVSYGACEANMGASELAFYNTLWQQAAAQGISVFVSSGDSGAAGCEGGSASTGTRAGINGLCSSPYSTCVGGTQFSDTTNPGQYWLAGNNSTMGSAQGYIPEVVWNESSTNGGSGLWAGGGGVSSVYLKPSWQIGTGVPADGHRDVPDVSLTAASHDGYLVVQGGMMMSVGGTSASSPSFAGLMALVNQKVAALQGNANPNLYVLASKQTSGGSVVFHDTTNGNNSVKGVTGFSANYGYDRATGLGSVDASQLVNHWNDSGTPSLKLSSSLAALNLTPGQTSQIKITSAISGGLNSAVSFTVAGAPSGVTTSFSTPKLPAPGSGDSTLSLTAATGIAYGTYTLTITGQGGSLSSSITLTLTIQSAGTFAFTTTSNYTSVGQGSTAILNVLLTPSGGFNSPVAISIPGLPAGVTASASANLSGGAPTAIPLSIAVSNTAAPGVYGLMVTATGGGQTRTFSLALTITVPSGCTLASSPASITIEAGKALNFQVSCGAVQNGFKSVLQLSMTSNKPSGVTIQQLNMQAVPGTTPANFAITSANTAAPGTYSIQIQASTPTGFNTALSIPFTVTAPNALLLTSSQNTVTLPQGGRVTVQITSRHSGSFAGPVSLVVAGLPSGVTAALSASNFASPGDGTATLTLSAATNAAPGVAYYFVVAGTSGTTTAGVPVGLVITKK